MAATFPGMPAADATLLTAIEENGPRMDKEVFICERLRKSGYARDLQARLSCPRVAAAVMERSCA